jgi:ribosome-binding protein aMBF1 (putative translation factor)
MTVISTPMCERLTALERQRGRSPAVRHRFSAQPGSGTNSASSLSHRLNLDTELRQARLSRRVRSLQQRVLLRRFPILGNYHLSPYPAATKKGQRRMEKSQHTARYRRLTDKLREVRERAGLTQQRVARKLKVYASLVSKCESGERRIDVVELAAFCKVYGIDLIEFLREAGLCDD